MTMPKRVCDIYGHGRAQRYRLLLIRLPIDDLPGQQSFADIAPDWSPYKIEKCEAVGEQSERIELAQDVDLSQPALHRLLRFVRRGLTRPDQLQPGATGSLRCTCCQKLVACNAIFVAEAAGWTQLRNEDDGHAGVCPLCKGGNE